MTRYIYAFNIEEIEGEIFFRIPRFPEIISNMTIDDFKKTSGSSVRKHISDALVTALQARIAERLAIPEGDNPNLLKADGFCVLSVRQAVKIVFYLVYRENCKSVSELARRLGKHETAVRRMLDLRHPSVTSEIEKALDLFGKRLVHNWSIEPTMPTDLPIGFSAPTEDKLAYSFGAGVSL